MAERNLPPELERRIVEIERQGDRQSGFSARDWGLLALTGLVLPVLLLIWGAS